MDAEIKDFIEKNIELIDHGEFEELYRRLEDRSGVMALTETLLSADIDPARYMKEIPERYLQASTIRSYTIPNNVVTIGEFAFDDCSNLTSITIPNNITSISRCMFGGCFNLTSITIPNSVTTIGSFAFSGCSSLTNITIPNSVTSIGESAFENCRGLTSITIPDSVTSIGGWAFGWCKSLMSITIPESVTSIGSNAFRYCHELKSINYLGTKGQWKKIKKEFNWKKDTPLREIKCTDGIIKFPERNV